MVHVAGLKSVNIKSSLFLENRAPGCQIVPTQLACIPLHTSNTFSKGVDLRGLFVESRVVFSLTGGPRCLTKIAHY